ncbi:MAG: DUF4783 domain-containing protein [Bacteroidales bacterium]|nr:DUF4783 domain-containing protein [Bacteroidales bacterium]MBO4566446.1 DUF4783 domain-containing protein [Bacteroidales bacterium]
MKHLKIAILAFALLLPAHAVLAQNNLIKSVVQSPATPDNSDDVFIPISKYLAAGNADALSAWFGDNLEIAVLAKESDASRAQARQIVKTFFDNHTPRSFNITHTAGRANMKYALGTLIAGGEAFSVTIFMSCKNDTYKIQQLKIERL